MNTHINISHYYAFIDGGKIPRRSKKLIKGRLPNKSTLRKMLRETVIGSPIKTMYQRVEFTPHGSFCPHCGHREMFGSGNMTCYPEHWEKFRCVNCKKVVGYIDNSPFIHALERPLFNYDPEF